jgi:hypothetical protein
MMFMWNSSCSTINFCTKQREPVRTTTKLLPLTLQKPSCSHFVGTQTTIFRKRYIHCSITNWTAFLDVCEHMKIKGTRYWSTENVYLICDVKFHSTMQRCASSGWCVDQYHSLHSVLLHMIWVRKVENQRVNSLSAPHPPIPATYVKFKVKSGNVHIP